jgi:hypothetical protein
MGYESLCATSSYRWRSARRIIRPRQLLPFVQLAARLAHRIADVDAVSGSPYANIA